MAALDAAELVLHGLDEPTVRLWVEERYPLSESLLGHYAPGRDRAETYEAIVEAVLRPAREGRDVCALFYGHPGVFSRPGHEAVRRARAEGIAALMLPAISSEDVLFADLGVDPGDAGCQSYEATDFLLRAREVDPTAALVLWQPGGLGDRSYPPTTTREQLEVLVERLGRWYPPQHEVVDYIASPYPLMPARARRMALADLPLEGLSPLSTLYVPPLPPRPVDPTLAARLRLR